MKKFVKFINTVLFFLPIVIIFYLAGFWSGLICGPIVGVICQILFIYLLIGKTVNQSPIKTLGVDLHIYNDKYGVMGKSVAAVVRFNNRYQILVTEEFHLLSEQAKDTILCHEIGHIRLKHAEKTDLMLSIRRKSAIKKGIVLPMELEADNFAAQYCGKEAVMDMLDELQEVLKGCPNYVLNELRLRKQALAD